MDYNQLISTMEIVANDPALRNAFRLKHAKLFELVEAINADQAKAKVGKPLKPSAEMVALQTTLFDNWPNGKKVKGEPNRYKLQFKAWYGDPTRVSMSVDDPDFVGASELITADELVEKAHSLNNNYPSFNPKRKKKLVKNSINDDYSRFMIDLAELYPTSLFAMVRTKVHGDGTVYHHGQLARVEMTDGVITFAELYLTTERFDLPKFVNTTASGKAFSGTAVAQSRFSEHTRHAGWVS